MILEPRIRYFPDTDTMAIELRPYPVAVDGKPSEAGGQDEGEDLVVHYAADGRPWLWEIEHASVHPEHFAAALEQTRRTADAA